MIENSRFFILDVLTDENIDEQERDHLLYSLLRELLDLGSVFAKPFEETRLQAGIQGRTRLKGLMVVLPSKNRSYLSQCIDSWIKRQPFPVNITIEKTPFNARDKVFVKDICQFIRDIDPLSF